MISTKSGGRAVISHRLKKSATARSADTEIIHIYDDLPECEVATKPWVEGLSVDDRTILETGGWLNDKLIDVGQNLLKKQFTHVAGFQNTLLGQTLAFEVQREEFIQILHNGYNHWVMVSTIACNPGEINIYDSMDPSLTTSLGLQIAALMFTPLPSITIK